MAIDAWQGPRVCLYAFDLLEVNGESLLERPLAERRRRLHALLRPVAHRVQCAEGVEVHTEAEPPLTPSLI